MYVANLGCSRIGVVQNPNASTLSGVAWSVSGRVLASGSTSTYGLPQTAIALKKDTSPPLYTSRTFGSYAEYSIFAPSSIVGMASGAGLRGGNQHPNQSQWSALSFTKRQGQTLPGNPGPEGTNSYGSYTSTRRLLPAIETAFPLSSATTIATGSADPHTPTSLRGGLTGRIVTAASGTIYLNAGSLGAGQWAVINAPNADIFIQGNLTYTSAALGTGTPRRTDLSRIPQLVIIGRNITINSNVTRVDAWLIAKNALATCNQQGTASQLSSAGYYTSNAARLQASDCNQLLRVNGPVIANKLYLRRTAGSTAANPGNPAEIFALSPDAYLWAYNRTSTATGTTVYRTTELWEVPPRY